MIADKPQRRASESRARGARARARAQRTSREDPSCPKEEALGTRRGVASSSRLVLRTRPPQRACVQEKRRGARRAREESQERGSTNGRLSGEILTRRETRGTLERALQQRWPEERDRDLLMAAMTSSRYSESALDCTATQVATRSGDSRVSSRR